MNKHRANRLDFAILLAFFRDRADFHRTARHFSPDEPPSACSPIAAFF
jgi:hypothetical protein